MATTTCAPCVFGALETSVLSYTSHYFEHITVAIDTYVTVFSNHSRTTSYSSRTLTETVPLPSNNTAIPTFTNTDNITWTVGDATLTYPTTYVQYLQFAGAPATTDDGQLCAQQTDASQIVVPTSIDAASFIYPSSNATAGMPLPTELLEYLDSFPEILSQFSGDDLTECAPLKATALRRRAVAVPIQSEHKRRFEGARTSANQAPFITPLAVPGGNRTIYPRDTGYGTGSGIEETSSTLPAGPPDSASSSAAQNTLPENSHTTAFVINTITGRSIVVSETGPAVASPTTYPANSPSPSTPSPSAGNSGGGSGGNNGGSNDSGSNSGESDTGGSNDSGSNAGGSNGGGSSSGGSNDSGSSTSDSGSGDNGSGSGQSSGSGDGGNGSGSNGSGSNDSGSGSNEGGSGNSGGSNTESSGSGNNGGSSSSSGASSGSNNNGGSGGSSSSDGGNASGNNGGGSSGNEQSGGSGQGGSSGTEVPGVGTKAGSGPQATAVADNLPTGSSGSNTDLANLVGNIQTVANQGASPTDSSGSGGSQDLSNLLGNINNVATQTGNSGTQPTVNQEQYSPAATPAVFSVGNTVISAGSDGTYTYDGNALTPGSTVMLGSGHQYTAAILQTSGGSTQLVVGGKTIAGSQPAETAAGSVPSEAVITTNGQTITAVQTGGSLVLKDGSSTTTLPAGSPANFNGQTVSAASGGAFVVNGQTFAASQPVETAAGSAPSQAVITTNGHTFTAVQTGGSLVLKDGSSTTTLPAGSAATFEGQTVSAASGGALVVNGHTITPMTSQATAGAAEAVITAGGHTFTASQLAGGSVVLQDASSTMTVKDGSVATFEGQTMIVASDGSSVVVGGSTVKLTSTATTSSGGIGGYINSGLSGLESPTTSATADAVSPSSTSGGVAKSTLPWTVALLSCVLTFAVLV